jgi:hypothetical protein
LLAAGIHIRTAPNGRLSINMKNRKWLVLLLAAIVAALLMARCLSAWRTTHGEAAANAEPARTESAIPKGPTPGEEPDTDGIAGRVGKLSPLAQAIVETETLLAQGADAQTILADLRAKLTAAGKSAAARAILEYLESGRDGLTGMAFMVGPNGVMISTPTMRTFLLDLLAGVDPQSALNYAEVVFEARSSADEFAICLRNVGRLDTSESSREYIRKRARELLSDATLAANPTAGFAEAFDALAYAGGMDSISILSGYLARDKGTALNMPAFLALDRLVIDNAEASLRTILESPALLEERPLVRAGYFARADLASGSQMDLVGTYVLKLDAAGDEAEYFFSILPNLNYMLVDGILTDRLSITHETISERVDAAYEALVSWESDPRYKPYKGRIQSAISRIREIRGE